MEADAVGGQHHRGAAVGHGDGALGLGRGPAPARSGPARRRPSARGGASRAARAPPRASWPGEANAAAALRRRRVRAAGRPTAASGTASRASRNQGAPKLTGRRGAARAAWSGAHGTVRRSPAAADGDAHGVAGLAAARPRTTRRPGCAPGGRRCPRSRRRPRCRPARSAGPPLVTSRTRAPPRGSAELVRPMNGRSIRSPALSRGSTSRMVSAGTAKPMPMLPWAPAVAIWELTPTTRPRAVEQRAAGVAGVDGRVGLDHAVDLEAVGGLDVALQAGDDARGGGAVQAQRVADGHHLVAHPHVVGLGQGQRPARAPRCRGRPSARPGPRRGRCRARGRGPPGRRRRSARRPAWRCPPRGSWSRSCRCRPPGSPSPESWVAPWRTRMETTAGPAAA